jgi:hypothetical protein
VLGNVKQGAVGVKQGAVQMLSEHRFDWACDYAYMNKGGSRREARSAYVDMYTGCGVSSHKSQPCPS